MASTLRWRLPPGCVQTLTDSCGQIVVAVPLRRTGIPGRGLERRLVVVVACLGTGQATTVGPAAQDRVVP
jgi:hypothetical protein